MKFSKEEIGLGFILGCVLGMILVLIIGGCTAIELKPKVTVTYSEWKTAQVEVLEVSITGKNLALVEFKGKKINVPNCTGCEPSSIINVRYREKYTTTCTDVNCTFDTEYEVEFVK